ncbi:chromate efflux transporter [Mastigocoleus testarum]|uniref:Chromate transporter n=1 Tax=Mastigocoleus testarum BC008 TaxID=371196 RepID=A0A0V7ZX41_9CYAN|nr:chromate efflux transporter [Mastigocoleus testarum]KST69098.1 chromate transporter [Mastigocoleus testarum BC008]
MSESSTSRLRELATLFFKLGLIGFGGPAAHIAMMEDEVVNRKKWLTRENYLDLIGATNLIPGPNSTEIAIHIGYIHAGLLGLVVAGVCFIFPAVLVTAGFAWMYVQFGQLPEVSPFLYGIKPAILAIIFGAMWRLGKRAAKSHQLIVIGLIVLLGLFLGLNELLSLLLGGIVGMLWLRFRSTGSLGATILFFPPTSSVALKTADVTANSNISPWQIALFFLKVGSVLYGSGYVLVAFLKGELVDSLGWLTQQQLLDAIAIGQFTPGPVLSTATFIGYVIAGIPGALAATLGMFLPSFVFVAILNPIIPRLRASRWLGAFLDAVNISSVALMLFVTIKLAGGIFIDEVSIDWFAALISLIAGVLVIRIRLNAVWIVLGGATAGFVLKNILNF